ncbi:glycoside hydrolase family 6 protein [Stigmatella aurantiaca]|uniref:Glucanase n=1 Tax=Stigmatella aurantiaca (strain DW4/3-1) TaxID=378806 RepID=Q09A73_STIAD|nr:glycoside hydrolase family 6 protein [Stigmatella aurantiaca]ADO75074.1 Endoglucanase [Stigmatella aurantiaca DW4/3-1]EAU68645.1 endoglucanase A [Stigmatella aurantiaca DW4/3-1]
MHPRGILRPRSFRSLCSLSLTLASSWVLACGPAPEEGAPLTAQSAAPLASAAPQPTALTELVTNGTFASGAVAPWWNNAPTQVRVENGRLRVDVASGTANLWDAIIGQSGIPLVSGKAYTLSFSASASASLSVRTTVQQEPAPYTAVLTQQFSIDGTSRRFSFPFTSSLGTPQGQVTFQLGGRSAATTVFLDDISLTTEGGSGGSGPLGMTSGFYVDSETEAARWVRANGGDSRAVRIQSSIASKPSARWFGNWSGNITSAVSSYVAAADAADKLPVLVAYNIPGRDCGSHSGGGAGSPEAYRTWISAFAAAIGNRPAIVIIEPDAVAQLDCLANDSERQVRLGLLRYATEQLRDRATNTWTYLDGGNAQWIAADTMAQRLESAGVKNIRGFALNVSNFYTTAQSNPYGASVNSALSSRYGYTRQFVVDTSRNGNGSNGEWCNPGGRKLGSPSQVGTGTGAELLLWVKSPGESDGNCGIAPGASAGQFSPDLAIRLIDGT